MQPPNPQGRFCLSWQEELEFARTASAGVVQAAAGGESKSEAMSNTPSFDVERERSLESTLSVAWKGNLTLLGINSLGDKRMGRVLNVWTNAFI